MPIYLIHDTAFDVWYVADYNDMINVKLSDLDDLKFYVL